MKKAKRKKVWYQLRPSDLDWVLDALRDASDDAWTQQFRSDTRQAALYDQFAPLLHACLNHKPKRGHGTWSEPDHDEIVAASQAIIRELVRYIDGDASAVADSKDVTAELRRLRHQLTLPLKTLDEMGDRTVLWMNDYLYQTTESPWQIASLPRPNIAFDRWKAKLNDFADDIDHMLENYPASEHQADVLVHTLYDRIALIWFHTTGFWPVTSKNATWPEAVAHMRAVNANKEVRVPYLLMLLRRMTQESDSQKSEDLERDRFVARVTKLRDEAATRGKRPRFKLKGKR